MVDFSQFPENSILRHLRLDIYADTKSGAINIFHDGEFEEPVQSLAFEQSSSDLLFVFADGDSMPLGADVADHLIPYFLSEKEAGLFQVQEDGTAGRGQVVPLKLI
jgi:hypothetical protein